MALYTYLIEGIILGIAAGFSPGPLFALVISETIRGGLKDGIKVSMAPFFTDIPLAIIAFFIFSRFAHIDTFLGVVSLLGAVVLCYIAFENFKAKPVKETTKRNSRSFRTALVTNWLSPHPYLFFFTVGGATIAAAVQESVVYAIVFIVCFVLMLVLSKIVLALITHHSKRFVTGKGYVYILRTLGVFVALLALRLAYNGLHFLQVL